MNKENEEVSQQPSCSGQKEQAVIRSGGRTCCVPQCSNNSRKNKELSFHKIPEDPILKRKWFKILKTKGLCNPSSNHTVCSLHFLGGKKTYENNIPSVFSSVGSVQRENVRLQCLSRVCQTPPKQETCKSIDCSTQTDIEQVENQLQQLKIKYNELEAQYQNDLKVMESKIFRMERFIGSDRDFKFYTGFPNYARFQQFFEYLSPACNALIYHGSETGLLESAEKRKCGKPRSISPEQELFMVLSRLRCGLLIEDLAHRYNLSPSHVSRICTTWLTFLHQQLRVLPIWPNRQFIDDNMPACFKLVYPKTRVIIDCTEIFIESPSSCRAQSITFSTYKHHNTAKGLIGISPNGYPSFVSSLYAGRTSDKKLLKDCGLLNLLESGDQIMVDRGFDIEEDLPDGVTLNIPPFLKGGEQLSVADKSLTRKIASVRVHVERAISRVKSFRILKEEIPIA